MAIYWYWVEVDGLDEILSKEQLVQFKSWLYKAASPKTIGNRTMELQRKYPGLDCTPQVREWRDKQAIAGPIGAD
jgi:hypothetical protein